MGAGAVEFSADGKPNRHAALMDIHESCAPGVNTYVIILREIGHLSAAAAIGKSETMNPIMT